MKLPIEPIRQTNTNDCWSACLRMVLAYYGCEVGPEEIDGFVLKDKEGGSFLTELARFAQAKDLSADCYAYNLFLTDPNEAGLLPDSLVARLREVKGGLSDPWYDLMLESTIRAIQAGVRYRIERPKLTAIVSILEQGTPAIVTVNAPALYNCQGNPFASHDVLLTGVENDEIYFVDPERHAEATVKGNDLMFALLSRKITAASAYLLAIHQ